VAGAAASVRPRCSSVEPHFNRLASPVWSGAANLDIEGAAVSLDSFFNRELAEWMFKNEPFVHVFTHVVERPAIS
jgi:hypothetical protein